MPSYIDLTLDWEGIPVKATVAYTVENDGIGYYEYGSAREIDRGRGYIAIHDLLDVRLLAPSGGYVPASAPWIQRHRDSITAQAVTKIAAALKKERDDHRVERELQEEERGED
jgi:hypothetical protein